MENTTIKFETEPIDNATLLKLLGRPTTLADIDELIAVQNGREEHFVKVVYCKDCKWKQGSECVRFADIRPFGDDFCSRGERREDERADS